MIVARVAVNLPAVSGEYDYSLPPHLAGVVGPGHLVSVPFGAQTVQGVVLDLLDSSPVAALRPLASSLDPQPVLTAPQIAFARQLAEATLNPVSAILGLFLPTGLSKQADVLYTLRDGVQVAATGPVEKRLFELFKARNPLRGRQIDRHFGPLDWRKTAEGLVRRGMLTRQSVLPPPSVRPKFVRMAQLAVSPQEAEAAMPSLGKTAETLQRRQAALRFLIREPDAVNVTWVYAEAGCSLADLQELDERELIRLFESEIWRDPLGKLESAKASSWSAGVATNHELVLTPEQVTALSQINAALADPHDSGAPFLLHGITGSGKTEIYIRAVAEAIRLGRTALVLVPEIALTPQTVRRFLVRFPGQVGLVHSRLSDGERYDTWRRAREGLLKVIIGPRSALFSPLPNVGLIVVDECHDTSYYQSEPPFYSAVRAAELYGKLSGAVVLLGSATPPVETRYRAVSGALRLQELNRRVTGGEGAGRLPGGLPPVSIVDMRAELKTGNRGIFSRLLVEALAETLERGEQAIVYLNRRGTATYVFCRDCGYVAKCPHCDTPLTLHADSRNLQCHRCGYTRLVPKTCPTCASAQIRAYGLGSEKVETEVAALFPAARVLRWDWETTREKDAHEMILTHFANHQADILVGTQMLAKGLDLPLVTLVGIVLADVGLTLPDPFAGERAFQLLTQVAGRSGRSARGGRVVLQTFMPENAVIQAAAGHDYGAFYQRELENRRLLGYPPFNRLARLEFRHADPARAESEARAVAERLKAAILAEKRIQTEVVGPAPCFFAKSNDIYRWQVIVRGPDPASLLRLLRLPEGCRIEMDPASLL